MSIPESPFVLLRHEAGSSFHWDLCLDTGSSLATWQLGADPVEDAVIGPGGALLVRRLPDHRQAYLTYEGPISGGRGRVTQMDRGHYRAIDIRPDAWRVELAGGRLKGLFSLTRLTREGSDGDEVWAFQRLSG